MNCEVLIFSTSSQRLPGKTVDQAKLTVFVMQELGKSVFRVWNSGLTRLMAGLSR